MSDVKASVAATDKRSVQLAGIAHLVGIWLGIAAVLSGLTIALLISRAISKALNATTIALSSIIDNEFADFSRALDELARGNLTARFASERQLLPVNGRDEIGLLVTAYNALATGLGGMGRKFTFATSHLRDTIAHVTAVAESSLAASAGVSMSTVHSSTSVEEIATTTAALASGTREQADKVREAGVAVEELARAARQIASGAQDQSQSLTATADAMRGLDSEILGTVELASTLTQSVTQSIAQAAAGSAAVDQTRAAMERIRIESQRAVEGMKSLTERSNAVEAIITTIEEIADQTNLLALNAAIEAARAGDQGRGFAVVADEVRKLAERAASSTREIGAILSAIRKETVSATTAMTTSAASTETGLGLAQSASTSLAELRLVIDEQGRAAKRVSERAATMRAVSETVTASVAGVSAVVGQNASASSEMSATTEMVTRTILTIADGTAMQSTAAEQLSATSVELASQMVHIRDMAAKLNRENTELSTSLTEFSLEAQAAPKPEPGRAALACA